LKRLKIIIKGCCIDFRKTIASAMLCVSDRTLDKDDIWIMGFLMKLSNNLIEYQN